MAFRVDQTAGADTDLDTILEWLSKQGAGKYLPPENAAFPFEARQPLYGHKLHRYTVLFTVDGGTVIILHIRHGRRQRLVEPH